MEGIMLYVLLTLALTGVAYVIGYTVAMTSQQNIINRMISERIQLQEHASELAAKNRDFMKELNRKQKENVSRETSYNKSYGLPEVVDWTNQQFPTGGDK